MPPRKKKRKPPTKKTKTKTTKKIEQIKKQTETAKKKEEKKKEEEKEELYWWEEQRDRVKYGEQEYDDAFFTPYHAQMATKLPADYKDPIFDEEWKILTEPTDDFKDASPTNLNIMRLFDHYEKNIMPELYKTALIGICIPSGDGNMSMHCAVGLNTAMKPKHRIHTVQGHNIGVLRNMLVDMALRHRDTTHIFFLDSDVVVPPFGLVRMLRRDVDIINGVYTMKVPPYVPLIIKRPKNAEGKRKYNYYTLLTQELLNKVIPIDATGAGCLLVKKEVLVDMGPPWFQVTPQESGLSAIGEDLFFFDKAKDMGYEVLMDTSIQCDHIAGGVSYPQLFFSGNAVPGPLAQETIKTWNRNAILHSLGLKYYKPPAPPTTTSTVEAPVKQQLPLGVEKKEAIGDAREVERK